MNHFESPNCLRAAVQKSVYFINNRRTITKGMLITLCVASILGLTAVVVMNHFHVLELDDKIKWTIIGGDVALTTLFVGGLTFYYFTHKYNVKNHHPMLENGYKFLTQKPRAYNSKQVKRTKAHKEPKFLNWFTCNKMEQCHFPKFKDLEYRMVGGKKMLSSDRGTRFIWESQPQKEEGWVPFVPDGETVFVNTRGSIQRLDISAHDVETTPLFKLNSGETLSSIRCCGEMLILGHNSGLVQVIKIQSKSSISDEQSMLISTFYAQDHVVDCWVDTEQKQIVTYSKASAGYSKLRREVWQF